MSTRIIAIQARMGSTRLPGKVMMPLGGKIMLQRVVEAALLDCVRVYVLTTTDLKDAVVERCATLAGAHCLRGSPDDVLSRYIRLLELFPDDDVTLLRLCADAPFIQPGWCRAAFYLAETLGKPVWIENFCHVGTRGQWRDAIHYGGDVGHEHAGSPWFRDYGCTVRNFVPHDYLMVNTQEDYEEAERRIFEARKRGRVPAGE